MTRLPPARGMMLVEPKFPGPDKVQPPGPSWDRAFLAPALAGRADALVTGDGDLLALAPAFPVPITSPAALRERLNGPASPNPLTSA